MAMATLSPSSVLAAPVQVNPQVKSDLQTSVPQVAQDAQEAVKAAQTDTITISSQALKMANSKDAAAKETTDKSDEQREAQLARDKADAAKSDNQKKAAAAYAAVSSSQ